MSALNAANGATTLVISLALVVAASACAEDEKPPSSLTASSSSTTGGGGDGGGSSGTGGSSSTSGTAGGGGILAADVACTGDYAFRAVGMSFTPPTAEALAAAFNEFTFAGEEHPITIVLRAADPSQASIGASPSVYDTETYMDSFVPGLEPVFSPADAIIKQGSFATGSAQPSGYLSIRHQQGMLDLALNNLIFHAGTSGDCNQAFVTLDAIVFNNEVFDCRCG